MAPKHSSSDPRELDRRLAVVEKAVAELKKAGVPQPSPRRRTKPKKRAAGK